MQDQLPKCIAESSKKSRPEFKEIEVQKRIDESHFELTDQESRATKANRLSSLSQSEELDEFVTMLLTPDNDLPKVFGIRRQISGENEWTVVGYEERNRNNSTPSNNSDSSLDTFDHTVKPKDRICSLLGDIDIL